MAFRTGDFYSGSRYGVNPPPACQLPIAGSGGGPVGRLTASCILKAQVRRWRVGAAYHAEVSDFERFLNSAGQLLILHPPPRFTGWPLQAICAGSQPDSWFEKWKGAVKA
jgi:hypothetical protein